MPVIPSLLTTARRMTLLALALSCAPLLHAQPTRDATVKARVTANLARFAQWPAGAAPAAGEPLVLCVVHRTPAVAAAFAELAALNTPGRAMRIVNNPAQPTGCHVLYLEAGAEPGASALLAAVVRSPVLTVGDGADFTQRGMIALVNVNDTIRFDVNLGRLRAAQLEFSSQALKLARRVED
jgi:hypothetical protein